MKNLGRADRVIRVIVTFIVISLYYTNVLDGIWSIFAVALASITLVTSLVSFCPVYSVIGFNTSPKE